MRKERYLCNDIVTALSCFYEIRRDDSLVIEKVIFNNPATIVMWADGTKTVVKANEEDFDPEKGLAMAISKKALGNKGNYFNEFKKWIEPYYEEENITINFDHEKLGKITEDLREAFAELFRPQGSD